MECPVTVPDRTMAKIKVPESAPRRIIFASKALRKHFSLTETQTCRGCSKRSRCRFFKAPAQDDEVAGVKHIGRVLFGMSQYSRAHLQRPDAFPFYFSRENLESAEVLLRAVGGQLMAEDDAFYSGSPLHSDIEVAEPETARELLLRDARRKLEKRQKRLEEKALSLPQWMRETLKPVPGPGMTERQRALLREAQKLAGADSASAEAPSGAPTEEPDEWMEEGATPGELAGPLLLDPAPMDARGHRGDQESGQEDPGGARPIIVVDGVKDLPVTERFQHLPPKAKERPVVRFSGDGAGIYTVTDERATHRIDLDQVGGDIDVVPEAGQDSILRGGYVVTDLLGEGSENVPEEVLQYVSLPPRGLDGVQRYHSGRPAKKIDPRLLEELWQRDAQGQAELPFLQRIPFDGPLGRSGGSLPPARLPGRLLARGQEAIVPPPDRDSAAARPEGAAEAPGEPTEDDEGAILEAGLAAVWLPGPRPRHRGVAAGGGAPGGNGPRGRERRAPARRCAVRASTGRRERGGRPLRGVEPQGSGATAAAADRGAGAFGGLSEARGPAPPGQGAGHRGGGERRGVPPGAAAATGRGVRVHLPQAAPGAGGGRRPPGRGRPRGGHRGDPGGVLAGRAQQRLRLRARGPAAGQPLHPGREREVPEAAGGGGGGPGAGRAAWPRAAARRRHRAGRSGDAAPATAPG
ncbi:unnamed protein product [Prorocentrum cordatum]|uniref:Uncharacterized protein n=1 Tax=Prorocentrum cordatum TaxID=2364126 RepID=A0ABN9YH43_9DINO|nr:unnamed protein product [Polarella glacialis]